MDPSSGKFCCVRRASLGLSRERIVRALLALLPCCLAALLPGPWLPGALAFSGYSGLAVLALPVVQIPECTTSRVLSRHVKKI